MDSKLRLAVQKKFGTEIIFTKKFCLWWNLACLLEFWGRGLGSNGTIPLFIKPQGAKAKPLATTGRIRKHGQTVDETHLQYLSPLGWEHINLTGDYPPPMRLVLLSYVVPSEFCHLALLQRLLVQHDIPAPGPSLSCRTAWSEDASL